jgi:hypothetical protein
MNLIQYERWKDFSIRMAKTVYAESTQPTGEWITEKVELYFSDLEKYQGLDVLESTTAWDQAGENGFHPCDYMIEKEAEWMPDWMRYAYDDATDEIELFESECRHRFDEVFFTPVRCCLRAGIDLACDPSSGVLGFTVGCVRKMYPEGIPYWVEECWDDCVLHAAPDEADILL